MRIFLHLVGAAVMSGAIFGLAALFPSEYISAIVSGQALGGILSALIYILIVAFRASPIDTAFVYFIIGSALVLITIICYFTLEKNVFFNYFVKMESNSAISTQESISNYPSSTSQITECKTWDIFCKIYTHSTSICLLYAITVSIYPSVAVLMQSVNYGHGKAWNGEFFFIKFINYLIKLIQIDFQMYIICRWLTICYLIPVTILDVYCLEFLIK